jgi:signal transduction histidine kinase
MAGGESSVVYAARYKPDILVRPWLEVSIGAAVLLGVAGVCAITWVLVGRTFQPVHAIRAEIAELSDADLGRRLSEVPGESEIAQLARTANLTLERLERSMERQRAFASDASHELRTPIAGMRAQIEAALMYPDDTDMPLTLQAVLANLNRLEAIITDLLFLARLGTEVTGEHELVDLSALVTEELARRSGARVRFRADLAQRVLVIGSAVQLGRLLTNLFDNAQRHADKVVDVTIRREDDTVVLEVLDDGEGIAEKDRERVFQRFTRLDAARSRDSGGSGLGLALVRDIAQVHGGTITIEPSERGARFMLCIPAVHAGTEH